MALLSRASCTSWAFVDRHSHERPTFYLMPAIHHPPLAELLVPTSDTTQDALNKIIRFSPRRAGERPSVLATNKRVLINPSLYLFLANLTTRPAAAAAAVTDWAPVKLLSLDRSSFHVRRARMMDRARGWQKQLNRKFL